MHFYKRLTETHYNLTSYSPAWWRISFSAGNHPPTMDFLQFARGYLLLLREANKYSP